MLKKIKQIISVLALSFAFALPATVTVSAQSIQEGLNQGACLSTREADCPDEGDPEDTVNNMIRTVINIFSLVVGVVAVIMIIIGGFKYITSGGDSNNVTSAKNTIMYDIIGLVIVALAQFIVRFVLGRVTE